MNRKARTRETTLNSCLAAVLQTKHPRWTVEAESTRVFVDNPAKAPDIVFRMPGGMSVILESEYAPATSVEADAHSRLGENLLHTGEPIEQVVALRIPENLSGVPQSGLLAAIAEEQFDYCLLSGIDLDAPVRFPSAGWITGDIDALASLVESISVSQRQLSIAVRVLENGVSAAAGNLRERLSQDRVGVLDAIAAALHQADSPQTSRMAMTIVANALTFHCAIASTHPQISTFASLRSAGELTPSALLNEWDAILEINYWPIFEIARRVLLPLPADVFRSVVGQLTEVAERLVGIGVTTIQEMAGQLFGRLIADRKFLATFYTRPPSAVLLAELAVAMLPVDYRDEAAVERLKVADLACGTGALLSAVYGRLSARARRAGLDDAELHPTFMEQVLVGADIMPAAVHVTASMLSAVHPSVPFGDTNIHLMPYGRVSDADDSASVTAIGSLELIEDKEAESLFGTGRTAGSGRESRLEVAPDSYGELRPGCSDEEGLEVWQHSASRVHINLEFRLNSQRLGACLTPSDCVGGRAWPSFFVEASVHELPIVLWLNTTLGLLGRWWVGSRQQRGRSLLSVGRISEIPVLDCRELSGEVLTDASEVFARFRLREFLPANEAYRDEVRQDLDRAVLCDLLGLPESVLASLETLREQWCREPTVHGGKRTRPDA